MYRSQKEKDTLTLKHLKGQVREINNTMKDSSDEMNKLSGIRDSNSRNYFSHECASKTDYWKYLHYCHDTGKELVCYKKYYQDNMKHHKPSRIYKVDASIDAKDMDIDAINLLRWGR